METIGRVICYGSGKAPARSWHCTKHIGINRLYYIHAGTGGYLHGGEEFSFRVGGLYYIPYTADFTPFCKESDPIVHTYIDFELFPPIIIDRVLELDRIDCDILAAAIKVFEFGGNRVKKDPRDLSALYADPPLWELCKAAVICLTDRIANANGVKRISDETILSVLEIMHTRMKEDLCISSLAQSVYMNEDNFIRRFRRSVGTTPYAYLKTLRLRTALCLRDSGMNLTEVAKEVGYSDASSLLHALKACDK